MDAYEKLEALIFELNNIGKLDQRFDQAPIKDFIKALVEDLEDICNTLAK